MSGTEDRLRYALGDALHEAIFRERVLGDYIPANLRRPDHPVAVIVGGQPGAGKSQALHAARDRLQANGTTVVINGDDFRVYHPDYARLQREQPERAAFYTDRDSGLWVEKTIAEAGKVGVNVIIESTMRDPAVFERTASALRSIGYQVEARAVAVAAAESWQGVNLRYETMRAQGEVGRWTLREAHDAGYRGVPVTLARIEDQQLADRVVVADRRGAVLYENVANGQGGWVRPTQAAAALEVERDRPRNAAEIASYEKTWTRIAEMQAARGMEANQVAETVLAAPTLPGRIGSLSEAIGTDRHLAGSGQNAAGVDTAPMQSAVADQFARFRAARAAQVAPNAPAPSAPETDTAPPHRPADSRYDPRP